MDTPFVVVVIDSFGEEEIGQFASLEAAEPAVNAHLKQHEDPSDIENVFAVQGEVKWKWLPNRFTWNYRPEKTA